MNKKIFVMGLSMAFIFSMGSNVYAKDNSTNVSMTNKENDDHTYMYEVIKIGEKTVKLLYQGEIKDDAIMIEELDKDTDLELDKKYFEDDVVLHDVYQITSKEKLKNLNIRRRYYV